MDEQTLKRLLFCKRLVLHGEIHSNTDTELDRFLAIHHLDNSVELFLRIIATQENILSTVRQDFKFKDLWSEINTKLGAKTTSYVLPLKDQLFNLHETRNLAQHQGDSPSYEAIIKYQGYTRDFLVKCFKDIFNIDFDKIYASSLIKNKKLRESLLEAESHLDNNDFKESMRSSAKAFAYLKLKERDEPFSENLRRFSTFGILEENHHMGYRPHLYSSNQEERDVYDNLNKIFENIQKIEEKLNARARKINEFARAVEEEFATFKLGIDYKTYKLLNKKIPHAYFSIGSTEPHIIDTAEGNYTKENALFCYEVVLESALKLQNLE